MVGCTLQNGLRILEALGSTRDGPLYLAQYPSGEEVAVLIPTTGSGGSLPPRYRLAAQIRHPNVAAMREIGELPDGEGYVVLECLAGEPLAQILAEGGAVRPAEAVDIVLQAAAGLEAAHRTGLVHANLSPDTILITRTPDGPLVKLIGFALDSCLPPTGEKPTERDVAVEYASPERLAGHVPDERSDVYSLGAVLRRLLAGKPASASLRAIVAQAMFPIPEHRFQGIPEFVAAVKGSAGITDVSITTRRRRPLLITAASAVAVAAGGFWLLGSVPGRETRAVAPAAEPDTGVPAYMPPEGMETGSAPAADSAGEEVGEAETEPVAARRKRPRARVDAVERAFNGEARVPPRPSPASKPDLAVSADAPDSVAPDTTATATASPPSPAFALETQAQVGHRIGLDEASRHLGAPLHAIEGMSPLLIGLAQGRFPVGADSTQPLVRAVYLDPSGTLVLLDQQRAPDQPQAPTAEGVRWAIGDVTLYLHGGSGTAVLRNLSKRVR